MAFAFWRQFRADLTNGCPIFARIAILYDIEDILEVHAWNAREPVHQTLHMSLAAGSKAL